MHGTPAKQLHKTQLALIGSSSSLHSEACNALGASDGVIHSSISQEAFSSRAIADSCHISPGRSNVSCDAEKTRLHGLEAILPKRGVGLVRWTGWRQTTGPGYHRPWVSHAMGITGHGYHTPWVSQAMRITRHGYHRPWVLHAMGITRHRFSRLHSRRHHHSVHSITHQSFAFY